nr:MAG TPA: hypothetical protein [Inoviridae sp.]DAL82432.1 MAG TPA: hypothetical protein [Inoviridae sp.]DAW96763.1 MAG TPA: hypothetical protein [Inoviridae sp.]
MSEKTFIKKPASWVLTLQNQVIALCCRATQKLKLKFKSLGYKIVSLDFFE